MNSPVSAIEDIEAALNEAPICEYPDFTDAIREVLAIARQAEALKQEVDSLKQTRRHSREASAALRDAFMEERKRVEALERERSTAEMDVLAERRRQVEVEGWTPKHDDAHRRGELAGAAACYVVDGLPSVAKIAVHRSYWDWDADWWKPSDHRRNLVKAAALIIAEIERLDRDCGVSKNAE